MAQKQQNIYFLANGIDGSSTGGTSTFTKPQTNLQGYLHSAVWQAVTR
jgi:hypothetical protein